MNKFFLFFILILITLFAAELTPPVQNNFVIPFTSAIAYISGWLMQLFDSQVQTQGKIIWNIHTGFGVSIEAGCNGVEAGIVLIAAMLAFPATWIQKIIGITIGMITIQTLNLLRIITLFYIGQWNKTAFEWAHLYVWQALIMLDVLFVMLLWLHWVSNNKKIHIVS